MIAPAPIVAPAKTIAWAQIARRRPMTSGSATSMPAAARRRRQHGRLAEDRAVLDDDAVADHHAVVDDDVARRRCTPSPTGRSGLRTRPGASGSAWPDTLRDCGVPSQPVAARRGARPGHDRPPPRAPAAGSAARRLRRRGRPRRRPLRRSSPTRRCVFAHARRAAGRRAASTSRSSPCPPRSTSPPCASSPRAGVHVLVEKPLAATADEARELIAAVVAAPGLHGAVGHVERFNPALLELRRRVRRRPARRRVPDRHRAVGPFPDRIRDVGVVKDLATHDLDLVRWLGGAPVARVAARDPAPDGPRRTRTWSSSPAGCVDGVAFNCVVDWLRRRRSAARASSASAGMLVADTLTADLTFYENGEVRQRVDAASQAVPRRQRGRHDALRARPARAAARRARDVLRPRRGATTTRRSSRSRRASRPSSAPRPCWPSAASGEHRGRSDEGASSSRWARSACRWPRRSRGAGHEVVGCDIDAARRRGGQRRPRAVPRRGRAGRGLAEASSATGRLRATTDTTAAVAEGPDLVIACPRWSSTRRPARLGASSTR